MLQAVATRREPVVDGLDPGLLGRLLSHRTFQLAVALNLLGFGLHVTALRSLPLFLVQSVIATSVAVTAVVSVRVFAVPLTARQWGAVVAVVAGLALLAPTASSAEAVALGLAGPALLLLVVALAGLLAVAAGRLSGATGAVALGLLAGVCFGAVALAARLLPDLAPAALLRSPAVYVLGLAGAVAFLLYSAAMHRGSVTTSTAAMVLTQTSFPAVAGVLLLGDRVRAGSGLLAAAGFTLALAGALGLAAFESGAVVSRPARSGGS